MSNTVNDIAHSYKGEVGSYEELTTEEKSILLEEHLTSICNHLATVEALTGNVKVNVDYILTIVGSYLLGVQEGTLDVTSTEPPSSLFEKSLYPALENTSPIEVEVIKEDEQLDYNSDSADIEGYDAEDTPDLRA